MSLLQENLEACGALSERFTHIDRKRTELAVYLCEDANQLSLEELFGTIRTFRELFIKALKVRRDLSLSQSSDLLVVTVIVCRVQ